jgi:hypothetical protein
LTGGRDGVSQIKAGKVKGIAMMGPARIDARHSGSPRSGEPGTQIVAP